MPFSTIRQAHTHSLVFLFWVSFVLRAKCALATMILPLFRKTVSFEDGPNALARTYSVVGESWKGKKSCFVRCEAILHFRRYKILTNKFEMSLHPDSSSECVWYTISQHCASSALSPSLSRIYISVFSCISVAKMLVWSLTSLKVTQMHNGWPHNFIVASVCGVPFFDWKTEKLMIVSCVRACARFIRNMKFIVATIRKRGAFSATRPPMKAHFMCLTLTAWYLFDFFFSCYSRDCPILASHTVVLTQAPQLNVKWGLFFQGGRMRI